jgi:hypothetical protein
MNKINQNKMKFDIFLGDYRLYKRELAFLYLRLFEFGQDVENDLENPYLFTRKNKLTIIEIQIFLVLFSLSVIFPNYKHKKLWI